MHQYQIDLFAASCFSFACLASDDRQVPDTPPPVARSPRERDGPTQKSLKLHALAPLLCLLLSACVQQPLIDALPPDELSILVDSHNQDEAPGTPAAPAPGASDAPPPDELSILVDSHNQDEAPGTPAAPAPGASDAPPPDELSILIDSHSRDEAPGAPAAPAPGASDAPPPDELSILIDSHNRDEAPGAPAAPAPGASDAPPPDELSILIDSHSRDEAPGAPAAPAPAASDAEVMDESTEVVDDSPVHLDVGSEGASPRADPRPRLTLTILPGGSARSEEPAMDSSEPEHPVWEVKSGEDLYTALVRWCARTERWEAKRVTRYRWPIDADATFQVPFLDAVSRLQEALGSRDPRPALTAYHGNHQIVIRDNSTELY